MVMVQVTFVIKISKMFRNIPTVRWTLGMRLIERHGVIFFFSLSMLNSCFFFVYVLIKKFKTLIFLEHISFIYKV